MKVFDCFMLNDELDLLKVRLEYLKDVVDIFVIVEADHTHSGKPKEYNFKKKDWFGYNIEYVPMKANLELDDWGRENAQRNEIKTRLDQLCNPEDIIMIGDLDEFPRKELIKEYNKTWPQVFQQETHYYYMNFSSKNDWWDGTAITTYHLLEHMPPQQLRDMRHEWMKISNGGWHFGYLGNPYTIKNKIESFAHQEFNNDETRELDHIKERIKSGKDVLNRTNDVIGEFRTDLTYYPTQLVQLFLTYMVDNLYL